MLFLFLLFSPPLRRLPVSLFPPPSVHLVSHRRTRKIFARKSPLFFPRTRDVSISRKKEKKNGFLTQFEERNEEIAFNYRLEWKSLVLFFSSKSVPSQKKKPKKWPVFFILKWMYSGGMKLYKTPGLSFLSLHLLPITMGIEQRGREKPNRRFPGEQFGGSSPVSKPSTNGGGGGKGAFLSSFPFSSPPGTIFSLLLLSPEERKRGRKMPSLLTPPPLGFPKEAGGRYDMERRRKERKERDFLF